MNIAFSESMLVKKALAVSDQHMINLYQQAHVVGVPTSNQDKHSIQTRSVQLPVIKFRWRAVKIKQWSHEVFAVEHEHEHERGSIKFQCL